MKVGISMFMTDCSITPGELAQAVEERGFESLWFPEHTHIPTSRKSPWGGGRVLPEVYKQSLDPFLALTAAAMTTRRIRLATGICLVVERDPIHTAKQVATLDYLSGGRFLFGIGGGWNAEEMANHGTVFETRFALMRERVEAMKAIWTNDVAEYHGQHVNLEPLWSWHPRGSPGAHCREGAGAQGSRHLFNLDARRDVMSMRWPLNVLQSSPGCWGEAQAAWHGAPAWRIA
jgi:alkanesulfonate monooxygenase SsuD/methylene tetrahydromethanopterin reductase-like flavin-dependent oxidoreductase (luciferase family)